MRYSRSRQGAQTESSDLTVVSFDPLPGIAVQRAVASIHCARTAGAAETSDDAGEATLTVPDTFAVLLEFSRDRLPPLHPLSGTASRRHVDVRAAGRDDRAGGWGRPRPVDRCNGGPRRAGANVGDVFFEIFDCFDRHGARVNFAMSVDAGSTVQYYLAGGFRPRRPTRPIRWAAEAPSTSPWAR